MAKIQTVTHVVTVISINLSLTGPKQTILSMKNQTQLYVQSMLLGILT